MFAATCLLVCYEAEAIRRKWHGLRTSYARERAAHERAAAGTHAPKRHEWRYYQAMHFLRETQEAPTVCVPLEPLITLLESPHPISSDSIDSNSVKSTVNSTLSSCLSLTSSVSNSKSKCSKNKSSKAFLDTLPPPPPLLPVGKSNARKRFVDSNSNNKCTSLSGSFLIKSATTTQNQTIELKRKRNQRQAFSSLDFFSNEKLQTKLDINEFSNDIPDCLTTNNQNLTKLNETNIVDSSFDHAESRNDNELSRSTSSKLILNMI